MARRRIDTGRPFRVTPDERRAALEEIATGVRGCTRCRLAGGRTQAVPGDGHPDTEVVFVGEGPGQNEDLQGRPFVGAAGGLLDELLGVIGWSRKEVFITNVVKCRPPGNRDPEPDEMAACAPWLRRQMEVLDPALIVTLGRFSMQTFLPGTRIGQAHGTMRPVDPATGAREAMAYAMYHPAAAFRQGSLKETMKLDMLGVPDALTRARERRAERFAAEAQAAAEVAAVAAVAPPAVVTPPDPVASPVVGPGAPDDTHEARPAEPSDEELESLFATGLGQMDDTMEDRDQMGMFS